MLVANIGLIPALADEPQVETIKARAAIEVPSIARLSDVKTIFVEPFGGQGMEIVRDKVVTRLTKVGLCVADSIDKADAILSADGQTNSSFRFAVSPGFGYGNYGSGHSVFETELVVRLTSKTKTLLWSGEIKSGWPFNRSDSASDSCAADRLVKKLCKDIRNDKESQICKSQTAT